MKKITLLLLLLTSALGLAQNDETYVDALVSEFTESLDYRGITNYFTAKRFCNGEIEMFQLSNGKMCASRGTYFEVYVVWQEPDGSSMIKKVDNCGLFFSLPLPSAGLYDMFNMNVSRLQFETVKPYEVANPGNNPTLSTAIHPCRRSYRFRAGEQSFSKEYRLYDLTNASAQPNLNYESNNSLLIVALDKELDKAIANLEAQFRRQF